MSEAQLKHTQTTCYHCGDDVKEIPFQFEDKSFCCIGCKQVFQLLSENNLCAYYDLQDSPGQSLKAPISAVKFNFLDDEQIQTKLLQFKDKHVSNITFHIPTMHCSSCIWLLESLYKLEKGIVYSRVDFLKKQLSVQFNHSICSLKQLVQLLASIGYEPALNMNDLEGKVQARNNNKLLYQLGVAGFCFGNIMLISFPEYFGLDQFSKTKFSPLFGYLNFALSLPSFLYSAQDYFSSAYKSLKRKIVNIDFPLALGILVMFLRSSYEVFTHQGIGFFDTLAGLVFFLLLGRWVQQRTIDTISFERDYKSYFPVAVSVLMDGIETTVPVSQLKIGDRILIRNNEIIPADSMLMLGDAKIDFSFVTGESKPNEKVLGELVYAGGRQTASNIELEIIKPVSQSYLTQLWNASQFTKQQIGGIESFQTKVSRYFTFFLLAIALSAFAFWSLTDLTKAINAFTAVLIIACPCALALSSPFALGNAMRLMGRTKFYIKGPEVVEKMAHIKHLVFDKTGTLTQDKEIAIEWVGAELTNQEKQWILSTSFQSVHPLSKKIVSFLAKESKPISPSHYTEIPGKGIEVQFTEVSLKLGSAAFLGVLLDEQISVNQTRVYVNIKDQLKGYFKVKNAYRIGIKEVIQSLSNQYQMSLLSGDNETEKQTLSEFFPAQTYMAFHQSPADKMLYLDALKNKGVFTAMIGDGLNDAGALKVADVGISVSENAAHFSPASDAILDASMISKTPQLFAFAKKTLFVIHLSFVLSLLYNLVGLSFAVQGNLSPLIAAVLMPISSISVIVFTTVMTYFYANKTGLITQ